MIDDNVNLVEMVSDYFENHPKIEIVGSANDGVEGLKIIKDGKLKYDLIILDFCDFVCCLSAFFNTFAMSLTTFRIRKKYSVLKAN